MDLQKNVWTRQGRQELAAILPDAYGHYFQNNNISLTWNMEQLLFLTTNPPATEQLLADRIASILAALSESTEHLIGQELHLGRVG